VRLSYVLAPFTPFLAEELYHNLTGDEESIHLKDWLPAGDMNERVIHEMTTLREYINEGLSLRAKAGLKVRQPLASVTVPSLGDFVDFEDILREDFKLKQEPALNIKNLYKEISGCNSLCIHVRRGDFIGNKEHEVVDNDYYKKAMIIMEKEVLIDKIYVFSDDIDWCKENMSFNHPVFFVDNSLSGQKGEGHMYLMSGCKNFIIPNSTFSWWGIWLSSNENKKVVAPKIWSKDPYADVSDIILNEWIKI
jgi:hypothetical protein